MRKKRQPIDEDETRRVAAETVERMAVRCRLSPSEYEQQVLLPAIRAAEEGAGLHDQVPELHGAAMRAARSAGFRTARGLKRWMENVTWRWRRKALRREAAAARARRQRPAEAVPTQAAASERRATAAERDERAAREREALERAADEREAARQAGIERRRMRTRRTVLGAEAAARAQGGQDATAEWASERWRLLQECSQEAWRAILRPLLGLEARTYQELIERRRLAEAEMKAGLRPRGDQELLARRKRWRQRRVDAWTRIGDLISRNGARGKTTPHETIDAAIEPRHPMP